MNSPRLRIFLQAILIMLLTAVIGCGKKTDGGGTAAGDGVEEGTEDKKQEYRWVEVQDPGTKAVAYSNHLMMTGDYPRALYLLENIGPKNPLAEFPPELESSLEKLRAIEAKDAELSPTLGDLKKSDTTLLNALNDAGEEGVIILRRHLLENKDLGLTIAIAKYLEKIDDAESGVSMYTLLKQQRCPVALATNLAPSLKAILAKHANTPPYDVRFLEEFAMNITVEESQEKADIMRDVLSAWNLKALPSGTLDSYADMIHRDKSLEKLHLMEIMAALYRTHAKRSEPAFDRYFSQPRYTQCSNYLLRASTDPRAAVKRVVGALGRSFGLPDQAVLENQLAIHYQFNEPTNTSRVYDPRSRRISTKLMDQLAAGAIVKGLDGNCIQFKGNAILRLCKNSALPPLNDDSGSIRKSAFRKMNTLMNGNYTFAAWVFPTRMPTARESRKKTISIIARELNPVGLTIIRSGGACMIHPAQGKPCIAQTTKRVPVGRWTHLAGVVDRKRGTVSIYMNGKLVGSAKYRAGTPVENTFIRQSHFLVGGITNQGSLTMDDTASSSYYDHAFVGKVDEVRLYFRALGAKEIKQLYDLHAGVAN